MVSPVMPSPSRLVARMHSRTAARSSASASCGAGGNQVLAIVEDQEDLTIAHVVPRALRRWVGSVPLERQALMPRFESPGSDRTGPPNRRPIRRRETIEQVRSQLQRQARLAAPTGARKRQQASGYRESQQLRDFSIAPDEVRERHGKVVAPSVRVGRRCGGIGSHARRGVDSRSLAPHGRRTRNDARSG